MRYLLPALFAAVLLVIGCTKPPEYPPEPAIEFLRVDRDTFRQGTGLQDSVWVTIGFTDGDGDIGFDDGGPVNLFLTDLRKNVAADNFRIPQVPVLGANNGLEGEIQFKLFQTCCIFPGGIPLPCQPSDEFPFDTVQYEIYMVDRAGNESNRVVTSPILIRCE